MLGPRQVLNSSAVAHLKHSPLIEQLYFSVLVALPLVEVVLPVPVLEGRLVSPGPPPPLCPEDEPPLDVSSPDEPGEPDELDEPLEQAERRSERAARRSATGRFIEPSL